MGATWAGAALLPAAAAGTASIDPTISSASRARIMLEVLRAIIPPFAKFAVHNAKAQSGGETGHARENIFYIAG